MAIVFTFSSEPGMFRATTLTSSFFISSVFLHDLHYLSIPLDDLGPSFPFVIELPTYGILQSFACIFFSSYVELTLAGVYVTSHRLHCTCNNGEMCPSVLLFESCTSLLSSFSYLGWEYTPCLHGHIPLCT